MERLGTADCVAQGLVVVRVESEPAVGEEVVDEDLEAVGTVVDVFGPVEAPYAAVSPPDDRRPATALGSPLYVR